jgi:hypothetical protein
MIVELANLALTEIEYADDEPNGVNRLDAIRCCRRQSQNLLILSTEKFEGSHPDNKIQSPRSPRSAPIDEGLTRQMS